MYVSDLARKSPRVLAKKSALYNWNLITIAIFYGLPVVQLVLTYQNVTNSTGNQDMCYFNFMCAHPLGLVSSFFLFKGASIKVPHFGGYFLTYPPTVAVFNLQLLIT